MHQYLANATARPFTHLVHTVGKSATHLLLGNLFYSVRAALGKHEFAHIHHNIASEKMAWATALGSCAAWLAAAGSQHPVLSLLAVFAAMFASTRCMSGPQRLSALHTVAGILLLGSPVLLTAAAWGSASSMTIALLFQSIWFGKVWQRNCQRYKALPMDMQRNGYLPGHE